MKNLYTQIDNASEADLVAHPMAGGYVGHGTLFLQKVETDLEQEILKKWKMYEAHMKKATEIVKEIMQMRNAQQK